MGLDMRPCVVFIVSVFMSFGVSTCLYMSVDLIWWLCEEVCLFVSIWLHGLLCGLVHVPFVSFLHSICESIS